MWWRRCAEVFFYFLFFIVSILSVILLFMHIVYAEVWSEGSIFFLARLCKQKLCRRRVKGQKRQSLWRAGSVSASRGDTTIGQVQKRYRKTIDKKEGHIDTKRHTQQAKKQDHWDDLGSTQQTDTWVATDSYPAPFYSQSDPYASSLFLSFFFPYFFLSFSFFCCLPFGLLLLIEIYIIFYISLRTKQTLAYSCWR